VQKAFDGLLTAVAVDPILKGATRRLHGDLGRSGHAVQADLLQDVAIDYVTAHSPVAPAIEARVVSPGQRGAGRPA
jgi:hypothetical protein